MASEKSFSDKMEQFVDEKVSFQTYKKMFGVKRDVFGEFEGVNSSQDHDKINCMGNAIKDLSKLCFKQCVNVHLDSYSEKEQKCVRSCIESQIDGMRLLMKKFENYDAKNLAKMQSEKAKQASEIEKQQQQQQIK